MKDQILTEARHLFARNGFAGTTVQAVATAAGVSKPSVLYHYPTKKDLLDAVVDEVLLRWRDRLPKILEAAATGVDRLDGVLGEVVYFFAEDVDRARIIGRLILDHPDETKARLSGHLRPWLALLAQYVREAQDKGRARPGLDPEAWVVQVVVQLVTVFPVVDIAAGILGDPTETARERLVGELVRMVKVSLYLDTAPEVAAAQPAAPRLVASSSPELSA